MSVEAVVAVHISPSELREKLGPVPASEIDLEIEPGFEVLRGKNGVPVLIRPLADATLVFTLVSMRGSEPDEISFAARQMLGSELDAHADARGLLVFPDVVEPKATSWAALVDEIEGAGEWMPLVDASYVPKRLAEAPAGSIEAVAAQLMSALGSDLGEMQKSVMGGGSGALVDAQLKLQSLLESPAGAKLAEALGQLAMQMPPGAIPGPPAEAPSGEQAEQAPPRKPSGPKS